MPDDDLMTEIRRRFEPVRMTVPLDAVMERGRTRQRRGRILTGAQVAAGAAAAAGIVMAAIVPGAGTTSVSAWTVSVQRPGVVTVQVLRASGLSTFQGTVRATGLPVIVKMNPGSAYCPHPHMNTTYKVLAQGPDRHVSGRTIPKIAFRITASQIPPGQALEIQIFTHEPLVRPAPTYAPGYSPPPKWLQRIAYNTEMVTSDGRCLPN